MAVPTSSTPIPVLLQAVDAVARAKAQIHEMAEGLKKLAQDVEEAETHLASHYRASK